MSTELFEALKAALEQAIAIQGELNRPRAAGEPPPLMTLRQAAKRLAVSEGLVRKLISRGKLPAIRINRAVRLLSADVEVVASQRRG